MSLPVVLPGSCCPLARLSAAPEAPRPAAAAAAPPPPPARPPWSRSGWPGPRSAARSPGGACRWAGRPPPSRPGLLPARPLLSLGLLQLILGCCLVALSFGALSLSSSPQVKNSCPFWAGSSVILSGIIGLTTWKRPMILLVNLFVLLSVICVLLNLAGFILGCQGAQFVSSLPRCDLADVGESKFCFCCEEFLPEKCTEKDNALKLYPVQPCGAVHLLLKKVLFALCALNALTTTVCLVAAALRYLQIFATRRSCIEEPHVYVEEAEEQGHASDPEDFVPPVPPPSYFATFYSCTPRINRRMLGSDVIPLPHIYGARIKGVEVFCPLDSPPPYEAVVGQNHAQVLSIGFHQLDVLSQQGNTFQISDASEAVIGSPGQNEAQVSPVGGDERNSITGEATLHPDASLVPAGTSKTVLKPLRKRSKSDPVLHGFPPRGPVLSCEAATQTELKPELTNVTLRKSLRAKALRSRPQSLIDYKSYMDTKLLVARFLEQSSCTMTPDIHELVEDIKCVLKSDEEHMEEAIHSASFLEQVMIPACSSASKAYTLPFRRHPGLLHLESCGDVSTFTTAETRRLERTQRSEPERPHSLIGVVRETVL
ncbi:endosomal transmembrane epsin interactor 1 isoform X1 [Podarcis raffonei]|uniref:endosomal transmembrane epsin interactor 1 isoform X1 n=1 Tax=Podarcis raffonei TaxID=65483 RepID=UPI0023297B33|nr:endosomal transmembrane epsin interactor 1 isoform X1 [Podarcis raffonei]